MADAQKSPSKDCVLIKRSTGVQKQKEQDAEKASENARREPSIGKIDPTTKTNSKKKKRRKRKPKHVTESLKDDFLESSEKEAQNDSGSASPSVNADANLSVNDSASMSPSTSAYANAPANSISVTPSTSADAHVNTEREWKEVPLPTDDDTDAGWKTDDDDDVNAEREWKEVPLKRHVKAGEGWKGVKRDDVPFIMPSENSDKPRIPKNAFEIICENHYIEALKKVSSRRPRAQYVCNICQYYCDSWCVVERHIVKPRHLQALADKEEMLSVPLIPSPLKEQCMYICNVLHRFIGTYGISEKEYKERDSLAIAIGSAVQRAFPGCVIKPYGSSYYRMGLKTSGLDLNLEIPQLKESTETMLNVFKFISKDSAKYKNVAFDMSADVPTIRFTDAATNIDCTISLNNHSACQLSVLLRKYSQFDPRVSLLGTAFRSWASMCHLDRDDHGLLPPHAFPILTIFFLQQMQHPVLPVIKDGMEQSENKTVRPDLWDVETLMKSWHTINKFSLGELWLKLLKFYLSDFDISDKVVSIVSLKYVKRNSKKWMGKRIAIEDPLNPHKNVSKSLVHGKSFQYFMGCLRASYLYFATPQTERGPIFLKVQKLPETLSGLEVILESRANFLKKVFEWHPYFQSDETLQMRKMEEPRFLENICMYDVSKLVVTPIQAAILFKKFNPKFLVYELTRHRLTGGKELPLVCVLCHEEGHQRDKCPEDVLPVLENLPAPSDHQLQLLSQMCCEVYDFWKLTEDAVQMRRKIVCEIQDYLQKTYPNIRLTLFGSSCNGFGLLGSDIDLCLTYHDDPYGVDVDFTVDDLYEILRRSSIFSNLVPITTAKVPILKFVHCQSKLEGDISVYNTLALKNTDLLRMYCAVDQRAKILGCVVKRFAKVCDICDASRGSLSSYAYVLMVIYFLQQLSPPVLPVLQELQAPGSSPQKAVGYFFDDLKLLPKLWPEHGQNKSPVGLLWIQFLRFYTEVFDFKTNVVCVRQKKVMLRFEKLWNNKCMAIEDPFDLNHNLGAGLSRKMHVYILKAFRKGRSHFGIPQNLPVFGHREALLTFFHHYSFQGAPPERGCFNCKRIGHLAKDCPVQQAEEDADLELLFPGIDFKGRNSPTGRFQKFPNRPPPPWKGNPRNLHNVHQNEPPINTKTWWNRQAQGTPPPKEALVGESLHFLERRNSPDRPSDEPSVKSPSKSPMKPLGQPPVRARSQALGKPPSGQPLGKPPSGRPPSGKPLGQPPSRMLLGKPPGMPHRRLYEGAIVTHRDRTQTNLLQSPSDLPSYPVNQHNKEIVSNLQDYKPPNFDQKLEKADYGKAKVVEVCTLVPEL